MRKAALLLLALLMCLPAVGLCWPRSPRGEIIPPKHASPKEKLQVPGRVVSLQKRGRRTIGFQVEFFSPHRETLSLNCADVRLYRLEVDGDLVEKKRVSCGELTEGRAVLGIFRHGRLREVIVGPRRGGVE